MKHHVLCGLVALGLSACASMNATQGTHRDIVTRAADETSTERTASPYDTGWVDTREVWIPGFAVEGVRVRIFVPPGYRPGGGIAYPVLYLNDGQDADAVALQTTLNAMIVAGDIAPVIAVAIDMPSDRMAAYGFSDRDAGKSVIADTRYGPVGAQAHAYSEWVANSLVPTIDAHYRTQARPSGRTILGWSLGAANALNLGWRYPEVFGRTGAFSPSLWLASSRANIDDAQRTRLAHTMIAQSAYRPGSRWFFAVGDAEETDDRDSDGVIDVLDDTRDALSGIRNLGHTIDLDAARRLSRADASLFLLPGGRHQQTSWAAMLPTFLRWAYAVRAPALHATGTTESWHDVGSRHVASRNVDVWLPPSYGREPSRRYPVLYMHDGQNLFDPALTYAGTDWDIDGAMTRMIARGDIREAIVVGVWNTPQRFAEYMPRAPVKTETVGSGIDGRPIARADDIRSDDYLRFLVEELKPFIDERYRTSPGRDDTFVMGSSMGGLISLYALAKYPQTFGAAGAVSTHWPACDGCAIDWLTTALPAPGTHRLYFDHGTATLDADYPLYQAKMDAAMRARGYREGRDWITRRFEGAEHNEAAWKARADIPLRFLLGTPHGDDGERSALPSTP